MAEHDAAGASATAEKSIAGFADGEQVAVGSGGRASDEYFCQRFVHRMPARSFVQLPKGRRAERADDGGDRYSGERKESSGGMTSSPLRDTARVSWRDIQQGELAAGGHYVAATRITDEGGNAAVDQEFSEG